MVRRGMVGWIMRAITGDVRDITFSASELPVGRFHFHQFRVSGNHGNNYPHCLACNVITTLSLVSELLMNQSVMFIFAIFSFNFNNYHPYFSLYAIIY